jgi:hypothetical protein
MKPITKLILISATTLFCGFFVGRFYQHSKSGYHYELVSESSHDFEFGTVNLQQVTESVGMPFLDTGTTKITFDNRVLYEAQRSFQEDAPVARNLQVRGSKITWEDGDYEYDLAITRPAESKRENKAEMATPRKPSD